MSLLSYKINKTEIQTIFHVFSIATTQLELNLPVNWPHPTVGGHLKLAERKKKLGTDKKGKLIVDIGIMRTNEVIYQKRQIGQRIDFTERHFI